MRSRSRTCFLRRTCEARSSSGMRAGWPCSRPSRPASRWSSTRPRKSSAPSWGTGAPRSEVALRVHTHVREDALLLYGFATMLEQDLFERLIGVSGIGPKVALAVLSGMEPPELVRAIERGDVARLTSIPGVGKKTSERIVLELKDRLPRVPAAAIDAGVQPAGAPQLKDD